MAPGRPGVSISRTATGVATSIHAVAGTPGSTVVLTCLMTGRTTALPAQLFATPCGTCPVAT